MRVEHVENSESAVDLLARLRIFPPLLYEVKVANVVDPSDARDKSLGFPLRVVDEVYKASELL